MRVELKNIDRSNLKCVIQVRSLPEESDFVAPNEVSISEAYTESGLYPKAILAEGKVIGFIMNGKWRGADSYWITRLLVAPEYRGLGYGRAAVKLAIADLFSKSDCALISLSFVPENHSARKLYESLGFVNTGKMIEDELRYELRKSEFKRDYWREV